MLISASSRPKNLKRGTSMKKFCQALGFKDEVGLTQLCGRIELSGEQPTEFAFLLGLFRAFHPLKDESTEILIKINGKRFASYSRDRAGDRGEGERT